MKRAVGITVAVLHDIVALFWCYVMVSALVFAFSSVNMGTDEISIGIIGAPDRPTQWFLTVLFLPGVVSFFLFILVSLGTAALGTVAAVRWQSRCRMHVVVFVLAVASVLLFLLIPPQSYAVALYAALSKFHCLLLGRCVNVVSISVAAATAAFHAALAANKRPLKE